VFHSGNAIIYNCGFRVYVKDNWRCRYLNQ